MATKITTPPDTRDPQTPPKGATAALVLANGTPGGEIVWGRGIGATGTTTGEVCFNTSITGYQEILTDPSYAGQIITFTFPHIGNVGANPEDIETATPAARGLILRADITHPSNWRASQHLNDWLKSSNLIGLSGVDTRRLTRLIRDSGAPTGVIHHAPDGVFDLPALPSLCVALTVIVALFDKSPNGYIQRVGLAFISILMFATCLGHYAYFANDARFQGIMLLVLLCVEINDVFAFACGKALGKHKLCPTISPNKTTEGFVGAILLTTTLFYFVGQHVFAGTPIDSPVHLLVMGALLSSIGQIGDLVMSSIKRDLNLKDMGQSIPGHGGLLDRFDSLIFVGPVLFHYVGYVAGVGLDQSTRLFTGG